MEPTQLGTLAAPGEELPILLLEDLPGLTGKSPAALNALLDMASVFPGSRFIQ